MRISDWSSDVCSSDLIADDVHHFGLTGPFPALVDDGERRVVQPLGERPCAHHAAHVRRHDHQVLRAEPAADVGGPERMTLREYQQAWRRSEEHTSELQSLMRISYAVFCLKKKKTNT